MKKTETNLALLYTLFAVTIVTSNVVTAKLMRTGFTLFGCPVNLPGAGICYAITFLITDVIGEIWGKTEANKAVKFGFIGQIFSTVLILMTKYLPAADESMQTAYDKILGQNWIFVIASLAGYIAAQSWDVWIFHKLRDAQIAKSGTNKRRWLRNNASTMTSQIFDTVIFIGIAFGFGFGWLFKKEMYPTLFSMMIGQYIFKLIIAALDTPIFYILTKRQSFTKN